VLVVPIVSVGFERRYTELIDRDVQNRGWEGYDVAEARQGIRFRLDEYGARLESDSSLGFKSSISAQPRKLVFDRPFLIYLKEQSSHRPYFALWVETPEVLEPWQE
jgi:serine protease inhibitor